MNKSFYKILENYSPFKKIEESLSQKKKNIVSVNGLPDGVKAHIIASLNTLTGKPSVLVCKNINQAEKIRNFIEFFGSDVHILYPHEFVYYEIYAKSENEKRDLINFYEAFYNKKNAVYILTPNAFIAPVAKKENVLKNCFYVNVGDEISIESFILKLNEYERCDTVEAQGQYSIRGGIVDVFPYTTNKPYRIEFFGDEVDSIRIFDPITKLSETKTQSAYITNLSEYIISDSGSLADELEKIILVNH